VTRSEDGSHDHHRFSTLGTVRAVGSKAAFMPERMWMHGTLPVPWGTRAAMPAMPPVEYGEGLAAPTFPNAPPALHHGFDVALQMCWTELLPLARASAIGTAGMPRPILRAGLTQDFPRNSRSVQQPHHYQADWAAHPMVRKLHPDQLYRRACDPLMALESFYLRLARSARAEARHDTPVLLQLVSPVVDRCLPALPCSVKGRLFGFGAANAILHRVWGIVPIASRKKAGMERSCLMGLYREVLRVLTGKPCIIYFVN
jgi:hypothetical protein